MVLAEKEDLLIVLSGSGKSKNILVALATAEKIGMESFALLGNFNESMPAADMAGECTKFGRDMQEAEERQLYMGHAAMRKIKGEGPLAGSDTYDILGGTKFPV